MVSDLYGHYQEVMSQAPLNVKTAFDMQYMQKPGDPKDIEHALEKIAKQDYSGLSELESNANPRAKKYLLPAAAIVTGIAFGVPYLL